MFIEKSKKKIGIPTIVSIGSIYSYLPDLLSGIKSEKRPKVFKEMLMGITQLYFDGLIDKDRNLDYLKGKIDIKKDQKSTLTSILNGLRMTVKGYYMEEGNIQFDTVKDIILKNAVSIINYGSTKISKGRHLINHERSIENCISDISKALEDKAIDLVVPVASGGFETAVLIQEYFGVNRILPVRYSHCHRGDIKVRVPNIFNEKYCKNKIKGKNALVIEDMIVGGQSCCEVIDWIKKFEANKVYLTVVCNESNTIENPRVSMQLADGSKNFYIENFKEN